MVKQLCVGLTLLLSGCAPAAIGGIGALGLCNVDERGVDGVASDQALRGELNLELENKLADFRDIELTVYNGRVLFTGVAASPLIKNQAVEIARNFEGVKEVIDGMKVEGEDGFSEYTRDGWITTKLKACLYPEDDVIAPNYVIRTFDKVIYIFGTAQTQEEMDRVLFLAYDITGVRKVVNLIEVKKPQQ